MRSPTRWILILVGLGLVARIVTILVLFEDRFYFSDEKNYFRAGEEIAAGQWLGVTTWYPPGPVYLVAVGKTLGFDLTAFRILQALLGAAATGLASLLALRLFGGPVAVLTALACALYPYLLYISGVFYTQNVVIPLLLLLLLALYRRQAGGGARWLAVAGVCWGVAACFMVPFLLTAPPLALWHWARTRPRSRGFRDAVLLTLVTLAVLVPITIRNYLLEDKFVFIASMGGRALYWANNPDADPHERDPARWTEINVTRVDEERIEMGWSNQEMDGVLQARAFEYIRRHPGTFLKNMAIRAGIMWAPRPSPFTENAHTGQKQFLVAAFTSGPAVLLGLLGAVLFLRRGGLLFPLYAVPIVLTLAFSMFHTTVRYRLTFEPLILIFAAAALVRIFRPRALTFPIEGSPGVGSPESPPQEQS